MKATISIRLDEEQMMGKMAQSHVSIRGYENE